MIETIKITQAQPNTVSSLASDLQALGLKSGTTVICHSSLSSLGYVCGGAIAVIYALKEVLGENGTLVMPTFSSDVSDPMYWKNPPVPEAWWPTMREHMPGYEAGVTPTRKMGAIAENFRKLDGVMRSRHPQSSFAACGPLAKTIVENHDFDFGLGEGSPLARLYDLNAYVLLLGVGHGNNSSLHLAEYRANIPTKQIAKAGAPVVIDGQRQWLIQEDIMNCDSDDFVAIGDAFQQATNLITKGKVGLAEAILCPQKPLVDFAVEYMERTRK
jgi:aminoglycoside 3-N-acetyltransferase